MDPTLSVILLSWAWRPEIILSLGLAAALHLIGRWRLRQRGDRRLTKPWRSICYLSGLAVIWIALMSPIDVLSGQFFYMHMVQHLLLVMIAPPLLLLANPMPIALWGLPRTVRLEVGRWLRPGAVFRRVLSSLTAPGLVWLYFVAALVGWHDYHLYNLTLESDLVHDLEHLTFFGTAVLFWWHVIGAAPRIHKPMSEGVRIGYTLSVVAPNALTGIAISFAEKPLYTYYTTIPRPGSMTVMQDQMLGGTIMWIPGSMMYIIAGLVLIAYVISGQGSTERSPEGARAADEPMPAASLEQQDAEALEVL